MSEQEQEQTSEPEQTPEPAKAKGYHVSDLTEGQTPDPLGDASLTAQERAGASGAGQ